MKTSEEKNGITIITRTRKNNITIFEFKFALMVAQFRFFPLKLKADC